MALDYFVEATPAAGNWHSLVVEIIEGVPYQVISQDADRIIDAASIQKVGIAAAVLHQVDAGKLKLSDKTTLTEEMVAPGSGLYVNQVEIGDELTLSNILVAMIQVSDNSSVRMISRFLSGDEINNIYESWGLVNTRVEPLPELKRFATGKTTPREISYLLYSIVGGNILSPESTKILLDIMSVSTDGYTDGIRRSLSSNERSRISTKYGVLDDIRSEVGVFFTEERRPEVIYAYFASEVQDGAVNWGATSRPVEAVAKLGRTMVSAYDRNPL
ncbi:serine hydrolase [Nocardia sp. SYP-A9097]|uniref:serine hydrolase n=1 Tax=Nocardia sp. SYP-A9097 TaxID=2663237 RepID=UPI0018911AE1|nr:serine hydrolase [Nocardia sp. SYP-A9097]